MKKLISFFQKLTIHNYLTLCLIVVLSTWNYLLYERIDNLEYEVSWLEDRITDLSNETKSKTEAVDEKLKEHIIYGTHMNSY